MTLMEISEGRAIGAEAVLGNDKAVERAVQMQKGGEARGTGQQVMFSFLIINGTLQENRHDVANIS